MLESSPKTRADLLLRKRLLLCVLMVALESYISYDEIYMLPLLQRAGVPTSLVSLPNALLSCLCFGQKRLFAILALTVTTIGNGILIRVNVDMLYSSANDPTRPTDGYAVGDFGSSPVSFLDTAKFNSLPSLSRGGSPTEGPSDRSEFGDSELMNDVPSQEKVSTETNYVVQISGTILNSTFENRYVTILSTTFENTDLLDHNTSNDNNATTDFQDSSDGLHITWLGVLGVIGFILSDLGYDSSMFTMKAYMLSVTPPSQHDSVLVLATLSGAVGGCITSLMGFLDLSTIFPDVDLDGNPQGPLQDIPQRHGVLDKGVAQSLVQSILLLVSLVLFGVCSLLVGTENVSSSDNSDKSEVIQCEQKSKHVPLPSESSKFSSQKYMSDSNRYKPYAASYKTKTEKAEVAQPYTDKSSLLPNSNFSESSFFARISSQWRHNQKMFFLCVLTFMGLVTNYAYFVYVTNYVAEVIYDGDPYDYPGSVNYENYVQGVHVSSLSMLTFYIVFVIFNLFHNTILEKISMRTEFVAVTLTCAALTLTLALTDNIVVLFVNAITMATYRSAVYTIPFILSNNYSQQERQQLLDRDPQNSKNAPDKTGVAMATVTAMVPASYFLVSIVMGPLMEVTGNAGTPIFIASGACFLSLLAIVFVQFD